MSGDLTQPQSWRAQNGEPEVELIDGPLAGLVIPARPDFCRVSLPQLDGDFQHFIEHVYWSDGVWQQSSTYVGFVSDETRALWAAMDDEDYWNGVAAESEQSFS